MKTLPSKELLSEVLKKDVPLNSIGFNFINVKQNIVSYGIEFSFKKEINIYELAHKCKEWALRQHLPFGKTGRLKGTCYIKSTTRGSYNDAEIWVTSLMAHSKCYEAPDFCEDTEPEAIFKACEWIMEKGK